MDFFKKKSLAGEPVMIRLLPGDQKAGNTQLTAKAHAFAFLYYIVKYKYNQASNTVLCVLIEKCTL
jgi:hypothetical protein